MTLSVVAVHASFDPGRRIALRELRRDLGVDGAKTVPGVAWFGVSDDKMREGCWINVRKGLKMALAHRGDATHVVHLAEDMRPAEGIVQGILNAVEAVPGRAFGMMTMGSSPVQALEAGKHWVSAPGSLWGGSSVWPVDLLQDFLKWEAKYIASQPGDPDHTYHHDDGRMTIYLEAIGETFLLTAPCLVSHRVDVPSVMGKATTVGGKSKQAQVMAGENGVPRADEIDWTFGADAPFPGPQGFSYGKPSQARRDPAFAAMARDPWPHPRTGEPIYGPKESKR